MKKKRHGGHHPGNGNNDEYTCYKDWKFMIYDNHHYRGKYYCFRKGEYYAGKHCGNYWGRKISFKVRKGYIVCFYDKRGRLVKEAGAHDDYFVGNFYKFVVKKKRHGGHHPGNGDNGEYTCYKDWKFMIYSRSNYKGKYFCFRDGCYYAGKDCDNYWGKKVSFKVRKGYEVCFYNKRGRLIKKADCHDNYFPGNFYKFVVKKKKTSPRWRLNYNKDLQY